MDPIFVLLCLVFRLPLRPDFAANLPKIRREAAAMWPCYSGLRQKVIMRRSVYL